ncbi:MAG TPA: aldo/keto reductase [Chloroflexia bacterium]|nr:aldo/keto reductase [Chloroflexia bacterium]
MNLTEEKRRLGGSGLTVPALGIGVWAWGDKGFWGYGVSFSQGDIEAAYRASLDAGVNFFDTAEVYGRGESERLLGHCIKKDGRPVVVATKFAPIYRFSAKALIPALDKSLERLGLPSVDLYQIHFPYTVIKIEDLMDALAEVVKAGKAKAVGVSNYNVSQMRRAYNRLEKHGIPLASNQVKYNLLERKPEVNGVLQACREMDVALIAYSPLAQGILTERYAQETPPAVTGPRRFTRAYRESGRRANMPVVEALRIVARSRDKTIEQVALNWLLCQDELVIPIPGAKTAAQLKSNIGALGWRLTDQEKERLDKAAADKLK